MTDKDKRRKQQFVDMWETSDKDGRDIIKSDFFKEFGEKQVKKYLTS
ncbi:MAG: hypothetical protein MKZ63_09005 [Nitrospinales bacterium]|nr:hypothetical protein [Nitrospinales bacterium]